MQMLSLANIDPAQRSTLDAISLVTLFPCSLLINYSLDVILEPFLEDVAKLLEVTVHVRIVCSINDTCAINS